MNQYNGYYVTNRNGKKKKKKKKKKYIYIYIYITLMKNLTDNGVFYRVYVSIL